MEFGLATSGFTKVTTDRLVLRAFTLEDVEPMHAILRGDGVLRYFPNCDAPARERVREMVIEQEAHWSDRGHGLWAVESRTTGELIGRSGLQYLPETDEVEVDFILGRAYWGQGFATEAGEAGLCHGFSEVGLESIVGIVHPENAASRRVLEKLGMTLSGLAEYFGMACFRYALVRSAYERAAVK